MIERRQTKPQSRALPRWPLVLAMAMLVAALGTLFWLRAHLVSLEDAVLDGMVRRFAATNVLGRPESRAIVFEDIEIEARASTSDLIRQVYVTKRVTDGHDPREIAVHPFYIDLTDPAWRTRREWTVLPIGEGPVGYLYVDVNKATIRAVNTAISLLSFLLAVGFAVLLLRQRGKEVQLSETISELETRKAQVIQLERLALAGQLSANVFHDIKKPVLNIKHEVADALDSGAPPPESVLRAIHAQTELFLQMLRDLGLESFVNANQQVKEWCDLRDAIDRSLRLVRYEQGGIETEVRFDDGKEFLIQSVPHRLVQLFSNLMLNAYQAMGEKGRLLVEGRTDGARMTITIEDSGPGIPAELREEAFIPFVTTKGESGGSGLGLYISRTIVTDIDGTITLAKSETLGGAKFIIDLPVVRGG
ncbi:hypothetical protein BH09SUM1_BH09SUM1_06060 [soil metagenome]